MNELENKRIQMLALVDQWRASGLSQKDFCLQQNLKMYTFRYWVKCSRQTDARPGFREVAVGSSNSQKMEVVYPNGVKVCVAGDLSLVASLIHLY